MELYKKHLIDEVRADKLLLKINVHNEISAA